GGFNASRWWPWWLFRRLTPEQPVSVRPVMDPGPGAAAVNSRPSAHRPQLPPFLGGPIPAGAHLLSPPPPPPPPHPHSHSDMEPQLYHHHNHHNHHNHHDHERHPQSQAQRHVGEPAVPQDLGQQGHQQLVIQDPDSNHIRTMSAPGVANQWLRPPPMHHHHVHLQQQQQQQVESHRAAGESTPLDATGAVHGGVRDRPAVGSAGGSSGDAAPSVCGSAAASTSRTTTSGTAASSRTFSNSLGLPAYPYCPSLQPPSYRSPPHYPWGSPVSHLGRGTMAALSPGYTVASTITTPWVGSGADFGKTAGLYDVAPVAHSVAAGGVPMPFGSSPLPPSRQAGVQSPVQGPAGSRPGSGGFRKGFGFADGIEAGGVGPGMLLRHIGEGEAEGRGPDLSAIALAAARSPLAGSQRPGACKPAAAASGGGDSVSSGGGGAQAAGHPAMSELSFGDGFEGGQSR
ncbi:hypothetical protein Vafri_13654, partial [Volvox africanus]